MRLETLLAPLLLTLPLVSAHARIKYPTPIDAPSQDPSGNAYNAPLKADGSQFPCKGLHKSVNLSTVSKTNWQAGSNAYFEVLGNGIPGGEGALAAHSGGSCQASMSFDGGVTWKVLQSFEGGCPRGVTLGSNIAMDPNQKFEFAIPQDTQSGPALFAWSWIAVSGNRDEFYMDCAAVNISGGGSNKLQSFPDMYLGEMQIPGHIAPGECASTQGFAVVYPNPGPAPVKTQVAGIDFKAPTTGNCFAPGSVGGGNGGNNGNGGNSTSGNPPNPTPSGVTTLPSVRIDINGKQCKCTCEVP
ncbi:hypothetical protein BDD12DRAFT_501966 [Trichophaea hybrida]|nr:hypothetical protein BDD12DRAFT_501966 [Trichophaea hybrida]